MTFGEATRTPRNERQLDQKQLAASTLKEDRVPISPQYPNDIEHNRRNPPGEQIIHRFADTLHLEPDYLFFLPGPPRHHKGHE